MPQNLIEKIVQEYALDLEPNHKVHSGEFVTIKPAYVMTHDNTGAVIPKFKSTGAGKFANPRQVVFTLDHNIQNKTEKNIEKYKKIENFAAQMGNDFYPAGRGIGHQIMCEEGYAFPGTFVVASDSHSNMYGGLGVLGTPVVRTDAAAIWATGKTWWHIPPVAKVELTGNLLPGVTGKDVIIALCGYFNNDEVLNHAIEFSGSGIKNLTIAQRLSIANMTTEWGALTGLFPIDEVTIQWLKNRADFVSKRGLSGVPSDADNNGIHPRLNNTTIKSLEMKLNELKADTDASYSKTLTIDLSTIEPYVSGPNNVKTIHRISEISKEKIKINKAYLVSCTNSRVEDLAEAAKIVKDKTVSNHVKFYIAAASAEVQAESEKRGDWQTLLDSGAIPLPPGCGPCIGLGAGLLEDNEIGISATNRNFKGRMGSPNALAYLASPAVVAASALSGYIDYNWENNFSKIYGTIKDNSKDAANSGKPNNAQNKISILDGFPAIIEGEIIFCNKDNMNTDGIFPGKYTYIDDFSPEDQARVVMENYDPNFSDLSEAGNILVSGFNFGTGSSREQAATALKYKGIQAVIAGSVSATYMRNAINNGFLVITSPELLEHLRNKFVSEKPTIKTGINLKINFENSSAIIGNNSFPISSVGKIAQELILTGGLENWVKANIK